nr:hypothetical protein [Lactiplantibacillus plantarum]
MRIALKIAMQKSKENAKGALTLHQKLVEALCLKSVSEFAFGNN